MGRLGEQIAALFLQRRGITIVDRNVRVGRGELDLLVLDAGRRVVVEVKTINARQPVQNAEDAFTEEKAATVARLAGRLRRGLGDSSVPATALFEPAPAMPVTA